MLAEGPPSSDSRGFETPSSLVSPQWLADRLADDDMTILDVTQDLDRATNTVTPDLSAFAAARIPGARFLDVPNNLSRRGLESARGVELHNMCPSEVQFAQELSKLGLNDASHVVLYSSRHVMWATRVWWLLHCFGFRGRVAVLDGGLEAWRAQGLPTESGTALPPQLKPLPGADGGATARPSLPIRQCRDGAIVDKAGVLAAINDPSVTVVDSLKPAGFSGAKTSRYGRRGHISSAINLPYTTVVDGSSGCFYGREQIREAFEAVGWRATNAAGGGTMLAY